MSPIDVTIYGAVGDGITDSTAFFAAAITANSGCDIRVPPGVFILDNLALPASTSLSLDSGATLRHKSFGSQAMINPNGFSLSITGGTLDGNYQNFNRTGPWPDLISGAVLNGTSVTVQNCAIQNSARAVVFASVFGGVIDFCHNTITNQAESLTGADLTSIVFTQAAQVGHKSFMRFNYNRAIAAAVPSTNPGGGPGGVFFAPTLDLATGTGTYSTMEAIGNYFWGYGQDIGVTDISPLHCYPQSGGVRIIGCIFEQCGFSAISAKAVTDFVCSLCVITNGQTTSQNVATEGAIGYEPGYHAGLITNPRAVITGNIVDCPGGQTGVKNQACIALHGSATSPVTDALVADNILYGGGWGIYGDYIASALLSNNRITPATTDPTPTDNGIELHHVTGNVNISGGEIATANGNGLSVSGSGAEVDTGASVIVSGVRFTNTSPSSYAINIRGIGFAKFTGVTVVNPNVATAVYVTQDGNGNPTGQVAWDASNTILSGNLVLDFAHISKATGTLVGSISPVGYVTPGEYGTQYRRTSDGSLWVASGLTSADWQQVVTPAATVPVLKVGAINEQVNQFAGKTSPSAFPVGFSFGFVANDAVNFPAAYGSVVSYVNANNNYTYSWQFFNPVTPGASLCYRKAVATANTWGAWTVVTVA